MSNIDALDRITDRVNLPFLACTVDGGDDGQVELFWRKPNKAQMAVLQNAGADELELLELIASDLCLVRAPDGHKGGDVAGFVKYTPKDPLHLISNPFNIDINEKFPEAMKFWGFPQVELDENGEVISPGK